MTLTPITVWHVVDGQLERPGRNGTGGGGGGPVLTVPTQPVAVTTSGLTSSSVTLSWQAPVNNGGSAITGYVVTRDGAGATSTTLGAGTLTQQFRGLTASTTYHLTVAAINAVGTGPTATKTITTPSVPAPSAGRFPGDPNPLANNGTLYLGMSLGKGQTIGQFQTTQPVGTYHLYWDYGRTPNALVVPGGPMAQAVQAAHAAGQLPMVSWHMPGGNWAGGANGAFDGQIDAWIAWCESQPKPVFWVVSHEPEGDGYPAADYRAWMQHIRSRITVWEQANGPRQRLTFLMCLVAATFTGNQGGMAAWWPGDGVVDVLGLDHYGSRASSSTYISPDTYFTAPWRAFLTYAQSKNIPFFLCEYGWLPDHPNAAAEYQQLFDLMTSGTYDCIGMSYFDSGWWVLTDNNGMTSKHKALLTSPKSIRMSDLGY